MIDVILLIVLFLFLRSRLLAKQPQLKNEKTFFALITPLLLVLIMVLGTGMAFTYATLTAKIDSLRYGSTWANHFGGSLSDVFSIGVELGVVEDEIIGRSAELDNLESFISICKVFSLISVLCVIGASFWYYKKLLSQERFNYKTILVGSLVIVFVELAMTMYATAQTFSLFPFMIAPGMNGRIIGFAVVLSVFLSVFVLIAAKQLKKILPIILIPSHSEAPNPSQESSNHDVADESKQQSLEDSDIQKLYELKNMLDKGLISKEEFDRLKSEILKH